jgi:hypothetical protein
LGWQVGPIINPLELDSDGEIIAGAAPLEARAASVPGTLVNGDKLMDSASAINQKV